MENNNITETPKSNLEQINETIKTTISSAKSKVVDLVVNGLVNAEINRRADLLSKLVTAINTFSKEQNKIKPDIISYDEKGAVARQEWSKNKIDEKKKFTEKLNKAQKAFENVVENNDYSNIENVIKELAVKQDNKSEKTDTTSEC